MMKNKSTILWIWMLSCRLITPRCTCTFAEYPVSDYLIRIASAPLPSNAADISTSDFIQSHAELRERAMQDPEVRCLCCYGDYAFPNACCRFDPKSILHILNSQRHPTRLNTQMAQVCIMNEYAPVWIFMHVYIQQALYDIANCVDHHTANNLL